MATLPVYRLDFGKGHTIATGMLNSALTAVSAAVVAHVATKAGIATQLQATLTLATIALLGTIMTFVWGSFWAPPGGKVAHRAACWAGAGLWAILLSTQTWTAQTIAIYLGILIVATVVLGFVGWLQNPPPLSPEQIAQEQERILAAQDQEHRNEIGGDWQARIQRIFNLDVKVEGIQFFKYRDKNREPIGYTVEIIMPAGGSSWETLYNRRNEISNDLDLPPGCDVAVRMGVTRRAALIDVTTVDVLGEEQLYPEDYSSLSVYDRLPMMVDRRGNITGPALREECFGIFGETGSGKSNTIQVIGAGIARMRDAHLCDIDTTGLRLSGPLLRPFLDGRAKKPAVFWAAWDENEALLMLRALDRVAIARNNHCGDLLFAANDDKMPISPKHPQFIIRADEIKHVTGQDANQELRRLITNVTADHRGPGIRAVLCGLRGTNEIIVQGIQVLLHNLGVLKAQSATEYRNVFTGACQGISPQDAPYPGCVQMRLGSSGRIQPYHIWRLAGKQLDDIAMAVSEYQPDEDADPLAWNALNGRDINGEPMEGLAEGELDCAKTRWDRLRAKLAGKTASAPKPTTTPKPGGLGNVTAGLAAAVKAADEAIERKRAETQKIVDQGNDAASALSDELERILGAPVSFDGVPGSKPPVPAPDMFALVYKIICDSGDAGTEASAIHRRLGEMGHSVDRATVYKWLDTMSGPASSYQKQIERRANRDGGRNGKWFKI